jgi:hypothetical protein
LLKSDIKESYKRTSFGKEDAASEKLHRVALVRIDVSEERSASIIKVTRIGELGTTLTVTSNRSTLRRKYFLQNPYGITSHNTAFFIVRAVKTPNLSSFKKISRFCRAKHNFHIVNSASDHMLIDS